MKCFRTLNIETYFKKGRSLAIGLVTGSVWGSRLPHLLCSVPSSPPHLPGLASKGVFQGAFLSRMSGDFSDSYAQVFNIVRQ